MKLIPLTQLSNLGKLCLALIATVTALMQVPQVKDIIIPLAANHPHFSTLIGGLTLMGSLLSNTQVQSILGIEQTHTVETPAGTTTETSTTNVTLAP